MPSVNSSLWSNTSRPNMASGSQTRPFRRIFENENGNRCAAPLTLTVADMVVGDRMLSSHPCAATEMMSSLFRAPNSLRRTPSSPSTADLVTVTREPSFAHLCLLLLFRRAHDFQALVSPAPATDPERVLSASMLETDRRFKACIGAVALRGLWKALIIETR